VRKIEEEEEEEKKKIAEKGLRASEGFISVIRWRRGHQCT
jgi:hypothetical protein